MTKRRTRYRTIELAAETGLSRWQILRLRRAHGWRGRFVTTRQIREGDPELWESLRLLEQHAAPQRRDG